MASNDIQSRLAAIILEIFDVAALQACGCHIGDVGDLDTKEAIMDDAKTIMANWHELHEFDANAFHNPILMKVLLTMYSDYIAMHHSAQAVQVEVEHLGMTLQ